MDISESGDFDFEMIQGYKLSDNCMPQFSHKSSDNMINLKTVAKFNCCKFRVSGPDNI